jgi:hypothetical protein
LERAATRGNRDIKEKFARDSNLETATVVVHEAQEVIVMPQLRKYVVA